MWALLWLAAAVFDVEGRFRPGAQAAVTMHASASPFTVSALSDPGGRFRFKKLAQGAYTLSIFIPGRGEARRTVEVGPSTADTKGRVLLDLQIDESRLDRSAAHEVSARALSIPEGARREFQAAQRSLAKNDVADATKRLTRAVELAPKYAEAWNNLGTIAYQTQQFPRAEECFRKALEADADSYSPLVNLGGVLINLNKLDEAWKYNVYAVLKRPADPLANSQLGMTYVALGKLELAEKHLLEAVKLDPAHFSHPQMSLAEVYLRRGEHDRAADQLEDFLRHHPDWPRAETLRQSITKLRLR